MTNDKVTETLLDALKQGMAEPGEQRLFRSGKLPGLFAGRTSINAEAAEKGLREGFIELVHTDTRGKAPVEWVKITAKGVDFVLGRESPVRALDELRAALLQNEEGVPVWIAEIRNSIQNLSQRVTAEIQTIARRLEAVSQRVSEAIKRAQSAMPRVPEGAASPLSWAQDVLDHLQKRQTGGASEACPLPELFDAVRVHQPHLSITDFHSGLRRLHDRAMLRFVKLQESDMLAAPEFALLDGSTVIYYVAPLSASERGF